MPPDAILTCPFSWPRTVPTCLPKAVQARFGKDQLLQLTGEIGYYVMLAMTVNACELEAAPGAEVLKP
jgi:hypothetical protein